MEKWRPKHTAAEYETMAFDKGQEIAEHILKVHNGVPASICHRCITLKATLSDMKELALIAAQMEKTEH